MKRFKHLFLLAMLLSLLCSCAPQSAKRTIFAMDTVMDLQIYGKKSEEQIKAVQERIYGLDRLLSVTREESEIWAINHANGEPVSIHPDLYRLLSSAQEISSATNGALDVTLYPVLRAWGFTIEKYQVPSQETIDHLLEQTGWQRVALSVHSPEGENTAEGEEYQICLPQGMELDLGALAKGYAGETCANLLRENGVTSALLVLGGNVQTVGAKPDGSAWRVLVQDPNGETGKTLGVLELVDQAAVTSGGYQRYFEEDGVRYWHILDPQTGQPARSGLSSVTVVGDSGTLCDGLSTALFVMGKEKAVEYWRTHRDFEALLVSEDGTITVTAGLSPVFTLDETSEYVLETAEE